MENLNILKHVGKLSPFAHFCCTIGHLPSSYMLSLTYEEQLLWLCDYLEKTVIPAVNTNAEAVAELQNLFTQLKEYVNNYFENLDIQEEINNKLNEMAESGQLMEIISQYLELQSIIAFNNIEDLKDAEHLINGSFLKTYGKLSYNDGLGAYYKVRTMLNSDVIDNDNLIALTNYPSLVAEKVQDISDKINVLKFGVKNDGTDMSETLQNLIDKFGGTTYFFPNGTYLLKDIELPDNVKIEGDTQTKFVINSNTEIASVFKVENKENVEFKNFYIQNAEDPDSNGLHGGLITSLKLCIFIKNSKNIKLSNVEFNKFYYGLELDSCNHVIIDNCKFSKSGYAMIWICNDSHFITIKKCQFDTAYSNLENNNTYMIAITSHDRETNLLYPTDITISQCHFKNNEYWEAVDSHGASNIIVENCNFENIMDSIILFNDERFLLRRLNIKNIVIKNNKIKSNLLNARAIIVSGSQNVVDGNRIGLVAKDVIIKENEIETSNIQSNDYNSVYLHYIKNITFNDNIIKTTKNALKMVMNLFGEVNNNYIESVNSTPLNVGETHLVNFEYNNILLTVNKQSAGNFSGYANVFMKNNISNCYDLFMRRYGSANLYATFGRPTIDYTTMRENAEVITSKNVSRNSLNSATSIYKATTEAGSDIVECSGNIFGELSILQNIKIVGAGTGGADLECYIEDHIDYSHFKISTPAIQNVTSANITIVPKTIA